MIYEINTSMGTMLVELDSQAAPATVENFVNYANEGFYDGTIFHRVIKGFMIQGGGFDPDMHQKETRAPIKNEANNGLPNDYGTLAMARTPDPHSATAQFFINVKNNDFLNFRDESANGWGYCVFGKVTSGEDVLESIANVATGRSGHHDDVPNEAVVIESIKPHETSDED
jgi:peptidyl-prolyl cis-trans isomerase B (cyclophilin B)